MAGQRKKKKRSEPSGLKVKLWAAAAKYCLMHQSAPLSLQPVYVSNEGLQPHH